MSFDTSLQGVFPPTLEDRPHPPLQSPPWLGKEHTMRGQILAMLPWPQALFLIWWQACPQHPLVRGMAR